MWAVALPFVIGGVVLTLFGFAIESWSEVTPTAALFASLSYVSLVEIALAWLIWFGLVRTGEASRVAVYVFFVPLVSIVIGEIFLDERLTLSLLIGTILIGFLATAVNRQLGGSPLAGSVHEQAYSGGVDFSHEFGNRTWHLDLILSPSWVGGSRAALTATQRSSARYFQRPDADHVEYDPRRTALNGSAALIELHRRAETAVHGAGVEEPLGIGLVTSEVRALVRHLLVP